MIDLSRAPLHGEGLTLFADHADPLRFHYVPDQPRLRLRADGTPELSLLKYRLSPTLHQALGAGLLSMTVDLGVPEERLERLRGRLARHFGLSGTPQLGPILAESGQCELVLIDRSSADPAVPAGAAAMVERVLAASAPSLYGDNAATFLAVLSAEGVALVEGALRGGGLPAGVVYALKVSGLRPALRARITARWQEVYHAYENRFHGGALLLATDIGAITEELVARQVIQIQLDELVPPDQRTEMFDWAVARAQDYVLEEILKPTLGQRPPASPEPEGGLLATVGRTIKQVLGAVSYTYTLRNIDRAELKTMTYELAAARAEQLTLSPQGSLTLIAADAEGRPVDVDRLITAVEPSASPEMEFDVGASVDLAAEEIDHLAVSIAYGERRETLILDGTTGRKTFLCWYREELGAAVSYSYSVHFRADSASGGGSLDSPEQHSETRVIRINPRELYQRITLRIVAQGVPLARFPLVMCDIQAAALNTQWQHQETLVLNADTREQSLSLRAEHDAALRISRRLRYIDAEGSETRLDWEAIEPGILVVGDPFPAVLDVQILGSARFGTEVVRLIVELRPESEPGRVATRVLTREQPLATWSMQLADPRQRGFAYRVTIHTVRNEVREGRWLPGPKEGGKLVVGEGIARLREVQLLFLGRPLAELHLLGIKVSLQFEDLEAGLRAEEEILVQDTRSPIRWAYPVADPERQTYRYQLTLIGADGSLRRLDPVATQELLIVVPLTPALIAP